MDFIFFILSTRSKSSIGKSISGKPPNSSQTRRRKAEEVTFVASFLSSGYLVRNTRARAISEDSTILDLVSNITCPHDTSIFSSSIKGVTTRPNHSFDGAIPESIIASISPDEYLIAAFLPSPILRSPLFTTFILLSKREYSSITATVLSIELLSFIINS